MKSACAFACASVTVVPNASQLFQPIGGVDAQARNSGGRTAGALAAGAADGAPPARVQAARASIPAHTVRLGRGRKRLPPRVDVTPPAGVASGQTKRPLLAMLSRTSRVPP